jgi:sRNA-binding regulator protein Hfq
LEQAQVEERTGKPLANLTRAEAKDWIKRFRDMLEETSPGGRVSFGQWPGTHEDREATYLGQQRDAGAILDFKLFNGERFTGKLMDFTPYTITIQSGNGEEIVLRKLAVVYYRHPLGADANGVSDSASVVAEPKAAAVAAPAPAKAKRSTKAAEAKQAAAAAAEHIQPLDTGLNSDRPGEPETPEKDHMDQDRGL